VSYASIPDGSGVTHGCYNKKTGALKVIDTAVRPNCPSGTTALDWNQTGPQGPQGVAGPQGPSSDQYDAENAWAQIVNLVGGIQPLLIPTGDRLTITGADGVYGDCQINGDLGSTPVQYGFNTSFQSLPLVGISWYLDASSNPTVTCDTNVYPGAVTLSGFLTPT
jgi:hypothetical protein